MRPPPSSSSSSSPSPSPSPSPPNRINIAAITRKLEVDNRLSLRTYCRIADNILRQADIFRYEKNMIDLYIMLLRFSSLVTETIPRHRDYRTYSQTKTSSLKKQLINALNELEELKPVVELRIAELDRRYSYQANGWGHQKGNISVASTASARNAVQTLTSNQSLRLSSSVAQDALFETFNSQQLLQRTPLDNQFQRLSLQIPRPKEETLSKHSILGPNGLRSQWNPPIRNQEVRYPDNIYGTPPVPPRFLQATNEMPALRDDPGNLEAPKLSLVPASQKDHENLEYQRMALQKDSSHSSESSEPAPMISFETSEACPDNTETCPEVIVRQPSPPPVLAEVQNLVTELPSQVTKLQEEKDHSLRLSSPESPMDLHISTSMMDTFMRLANSNTVKNLETCGILAGSLKNRVFSITALIIPKQESTANSCQATNEEEIFDVQDKRSLFQLGWIHTHPTQSCFMSSIDLHTHYSYQVMLPEAVAIVMAPKDSCKKHGIFRLTTPGGMSIIRQCELRGFHPHDPPADGGPLYKQCTDVYMNPGLKFDVIDLR